jgi:hypothetical protein
MAVDNNVVKLSCFSAHIYVGIGLKSAKHDAGIELRFMDSG